MLWPMRLILEQVPLTGSTSRTPRPTIFCCCITFSQSLLVRKLFPNKKNVFPHPAPDLHIPRPTPCISPRPPQVFAGSTHHARGMGCDEPFFLPTDAWQRWNYGWRQGRKLPMHPPNRRGLISPSPTLLSLGMRAERLPQDSFAGLPMRMSWPTARRVNSSYSNPQSLMLVLLFAR